MNRWADEKGAIPIVEGSILFPICFLILFLMLFFSLFLFLQTFREGRLRRILAQPTTEAAFLKPEDSLLAQSLRTPGRFTKEGLFLVRLQLEQQESEDGGTPFHFFKLSSYPIHFKRSSVWSSSATNLWRYEAINGFAASAAGQSGKEKP